MKIDLSRFTGRFRQETRDNLSTLDGTIALLDSAIREGGAIDDIVREMMRIVHAVKGAARMLAFEDVTRLCHSLEEMLIAIRAKGEAATWQVDLMVEARKGVERLIALPPQAREAADASPEWLDSLIKELQSGAKGQPGKRSVNQPEKSEADRVPAPGVESDQAIPRSEADWKQATVRVDVDTIDDLLYYGRELTQAIDGLRKTHADIDRIRADLDKVLESATTGFSEKPIGLAEVDKWFKRLTRISLNLRERIADVDRNVRQIDSGAVELRMRPIAELFETIPLQVRDLAKALGKEVEVDFSGESVRLDGRIVELLREPMLHIIRNALDHGIESPEERESIGKSPGGRLTVGAFENAGWARIVIADDGRGIDLQKVWERAAELGLTKEIPGQVADLKQGYKFLFDDRFTSRRGATEISGRGVGLAAVKRRLQELRGDVTIQSVVGMGARFTLSMPSSLSSQRTLVTAISTPHGRLYVAFPTAMVKGTTHRDQPSDKIAGNEREGGMDLVRILSLSKLLAGEHADPTEKENYLIHCSDGLRGAALAVEQVVAETEVIIEPLPHIARSAEVIAGAAPLTSDDIMLVLNVPSLLTVALEKSVKEVTFAE